MGRQKRNKIYLSSKEYKGYGGKTKASAQGNNSVPFDRCLLSFTPFTVPVCDMNGYVFELTNIIPYLQQHKRHPITDEAFDIKNLIKLHYHKNKNQEYIHDELILEKNLPYHDAKTNIGKNVYKMVEPEHGIKLHNVLPTTEVNPNIMKKEYKNKSSKDYKLKPKISAGGFEGKGIHHRKLQERKFKNLSNNGKNVINKLVNQSFSRY